MSLLQLKDISKQYRARRSFWEKTRKIQALNNVSLTLDQGTCTGLVGRSGSGKSTLAKIIMAIEIPEHGDVLFKGKNIFQQNKANQRKLRRHFQMVFQDPFSALNPKLPIGKSIAEPIDNFENISSIEKREKVRQLLEAVGLKASDIYKYPHQFSGGQLQRVNIARAIAIKPDLLVLDEVVSSLDIMVQVQILDLLLELKEKYHLTYLFISHDLHAAKYISDHFIVMDHGEIVEEIKNVKQVDTLEHQVSKDLLASVLLAH